MVMYDPRSTLKGDSGSTKDLNQGDVLRRVPLPKSPVDKSLTKRKGQSITWPFGAQEFAAALSTPEAQRDLRVMVGVEIHDYVIVLSNACDNTDGAWQLVLAPIVRFEFSADADDEAKQWRQISVLATGASAPRQFYLPAFGEMPRSRVDLASITPVTHSYLQRCVTEAETDRAFGLTPEAQRHLQRALDLFFSRNAREDYDWPSREDLELKRAWLQEMVRAGGRRQEAYKAELDELGRRLAGEGES